MKKREAEFTTRFKKWLHAQPSSDSAAAYEIKVTTGKSIPFSDVQPHQVDALVQVRENFFSFKIPDAGYQNPFDMFIMNKQRAYVVMAFLTPRQPAKVWVIDIRVFLTMREERNVLGIKSANEDSLYQYNKEYGDDCRCYVF